MVIYNVTAQLEPPIATKWLEWMKEIHLPEVFRCGAFEAINILKIHSDTLDNISYAVQYVAASNAILQNYLNQWANKHEAAENKAFGQKVLRFQTRLEIIHSVT